MSALISLSEELACFDLSSEDQLDLSAIGSPSRLLSDERRVPVRLFSSLDLTAGQRSKETRPFSPRQGRWFLMPASGADTFWGKGFLATALGTASPDRKKTHRGQNAQASSGRPRGLKKERGSACVED